MKNKIINFDEKYFFERSAQEPNSGCWIWLKAITPKGYGWMSKDKTWNGAHRFCYEVTRGVNLKTKQYVCHKCDVRCCVNPDHLFLGDQLANMSDCAKKGRTRVPRIKAEKHYKTRLTNDQAVEIFKSTAPIHTLMEIYNVKYGVIYSIKKGRNWRSVTEELV